MGSDWGSGEDDWSNWGNDWEDNWNAENYYTRSLNKIGMKLKSVAKKSPNKFKALFKRGLSATNSKKLMKRMMNEENFCSGYMAKMKTCIADVFANGTGLCDCGIMEVGMGVGIQQMADNFLAQVCENEGLVFTCDGLSHEQKQCIEMFHHDDYSGFLHYPLSDLCEGEKMIRNCTQILSTLDATTCSFGGLVSGSAFPKLFETYLNLEMGMCPITVILDKCKLALIPDEEQFLYNPANLFKAELQSNIECAQTKASNLAECAGADDGFFAGIQGFLTSFADAHLGIEKEVIKVYNGCCSASSIKKKSVLQEKKKQDKREMLLKSLIKELESL